MPTITPQIQADLYKEADVRFDAQTGYKPGYKLDANKPLDRAMMPVWIDIYRKVLNEWRAGKIVWTFSNPAVVGFIKDAAHFADEAAAHIGEVVRQSVGGAPPYAPEVKGPLQKAHDAHVASQQATAAAAQHQPPTVSPAHVADAAHHAMHFVMNGAGQGIRVIDNPADAIAAMQVSSAPAKAAAQTASTPEQAAAAATHDKPLHEFKAGEAVAIGASIVAALGLVAYGIENHAAPRISRHFRRTQRMRRRAA